MMEERTLITAGNTKLTNNITGSLTASSGTYVIDLAGKTWSATTSIALNVNGASVKLIDTVGGGKIIVTQNDAVEVNGGTLTAEGVSETYGRVSGGIPEEVLASCVTVVKSEDTEVLPFL